jgi:hypothetical protein
MGAFYRDYDQAVREAQALADLCCHDAAIRKATEYGKRGFIVRLMSDDSDAVLAERVRPTGPQNPARGASR